MGIVRANESDWANWKRRFAEHECFFCSKPGNGLPMVYWDGYSPDRGDAAGILTITVHAKCAREFGKHLIKDALRAQEEMAHPLGMSFRFFVQRDADATDFEEQAQQVADKWLYERPDE